MEKLYVEQSIDIQASVGEVWAVLTDSERTKQWVGHFQPQLARLESDWNVSSPVYWKTSDDKLAVDGNVVSAEPPYALAFTVHDVNHSFDDVQSADDGIKYKLTAHDGSTTLTVTQGDFGKIPEGRKYFQATAESWERALPVIKKLAE